MVAARVPVRTITVRRPGLDYPEDTFPKYFVAGDPLASHVAAMLSAVFPAGEEFFVRSVAHYRDQIDDPELAAQVRAFIGQESRHGHEHRHFNERLQQLGYPTLFVDRLVGRLTELLERMAPPSLQLATTAALEHYTATLAEVVLTDESVREEFATDEVRELFTWHALEETEHKAVAFDVFQQVCGNQRLRVAVMRVIHVDFLCEMGLYVLLSLVLDRDVRRNPRRMLRSLANIRHHPLVSRRVFDRIRDYHRRDFHPDDHDTTPLLARWRAAMSA